jgi:hypothetical protein
MPAFPSLDLTEFDLSQSDTVRIVGRTAQTATRLARDVGFVAVGFGVMALVEVRRRTAR